MTNGGRAASGALSRYTPVTSAISVLSPISVLYRNSMPAYASNTLIYRLCLCLKCLVYFCLHNFMQPCGIGHNLTQCLNHPLLDKGFRLLGWLGIPGDVDMYILPSQTCHRLLLQFTACACVSWQSNHISLLASSVFWIPIIGYTWLMPCAG